MASRPPISLRMLFQGTELLCKSDLLLLSKILIAKGQHLIVKECLIDRIASRSAKRVP